MDDENRGVPTPEGEGSSEAPGHATGGGESSVNNPPVGRIAPPEPGSWRRLHASHGSAVRRR
jgi:hypothetical protein